MYYKRKIDTVLDGWLKKENKSPALVIGIRQCGKTKTIREFAKRNNLKLIELNFWTNPKLCSDFEGSLDVDTIAAINKGNLGQRKGAIYESIVFDALNKAGIDTFYFAKSTGLEIDFVISYNGFPTLIEAKAKTGNTKSSKTVMKHPEHYGKTKLIKIGDYNITEEGDTITIPHYLTFVLGKAKYDF